MATRRKSERRILEVVPASAADDAPAARSALLELVTHETENRKPLSGAVIGTLQNVDACGEPLVDFAANGTGAGVPARTIVSIRSGDIGRSVVLLFENGDSRKPIVIGLIQEASGRQPAEGLLNADQRPSHDVEVDGERLILTAQKEIVLRCGKATIILTRAGKILIRGAYLLNRSSGVNRIKGGSVQIN